MKTYNMASRNFPLRILVYSDMVGAIIGRSGSTIRSITQQTMAKIDVHREDSPDQQEKVITITGTPDSCSEACFRIMEVIYNEKNLNHEESGLNHDIELKILAPSNLIGRLIGRSGSSIKRITEQTSTKMNVSMDSITETTGEHVIVVVGSINQVCQAEKIISSKLRAAYISDMNNSLQTMSQQPYLFNNVSLPFMPNPYAHNPVLSSLVNAPTSHGSNVISRMPVSTHQGRMGSQMYQTTPGYLPVYPNMNVPSSAPSLLSFNSVASSFDCERESVYIYIPCTMVGAIIGKSGAAIKEMINTSGATIKVATTPVSTETYRATEDKQNIPKNKEVKVNPNSEDLAEPSAKDDSNHEEAEKIRTTATTASSKAAPSFQPSSVDNQTRRVTIVGYPASQYSAQYMIYRKISIESGQSDISLAVEIHVPSHLVGMIIGKGGTNVKQLQKTTRTTIRLNEERPTQPSANSGNETETSVQITGEFEGSQTAQRHIRNMIRRSLHARQMRFSQSRANESTASDNNAQIDSLTEDSTKNDKGLEPLLCDANDKSEKSTDDKIGNSSTIDKDPSKTESPSPSSDVERSQQSASEEKSQLTSLNMPDSTDTDGGNLNSLVSNNNTMSNNLNLCEKSLTDKSSVKRHEDSGDVDEHEPNISPKDSYPVENGRAMVDTNSEGPP